MAADRYALRPIAKGYRAVTTADFRSKTRTFLNNLKTPLTVINDVLQLNFKNAGIDLSRFIINSTLGFFGVYDVAGKMGLPLNTQGFGTTMAVWNFCNSCCSCWFHLIYIYKEEKDHAEKN